MECFGPKSLMGFIRLILFVCIGWNLTKEVETEEMPVYTYLKLDGYTVMKADATHEYKPWTSIRCSAACYETPGCHGYYFLQGICKLYKGIRKISKQDSSHVMVQENKREILEYNRYVFVEGRWIRYTEQKRTYRGGLEYCKEPLEEARHFVFKNTDDSQFFIRKVDEIDDEVWLGLDDEANEADDEDSGYTWLDGSKILRSQWGTYSIDKIDDDNDEKDYGAAKINNNEVEIKFKKITDEYATFCEYFGHVDEWQITQ